MISKSIITPNTPIAGWCLSILLNFLLIYVFRVNHLLGNALDLNTRTCQDTGSRVRGDDMLYLRIASVEWLPGSKLGLNEVGGYLCHSHESGNPAFFGLPSSLRECLVSQPDNPHAKQQKGWGEGRRVTCFPSAPNRTMTRYERRPTCPANRSTNSNPNV
jgi:hypothetical protein